MLTAGHEPGNMRHVDEQMRADGIGDLAEPREINDAGIRGGARGDHRRPDFLGLFLQSVVIDLLRFRADAVLTDLVKFAGKIRGMAVGEMAAVGEVHRQNLVARLQHREVNGHVRLRAAVRLDVYVFAAEQPLRTVDRELLDGVDVLTAAVPAFARIALGILVRQDAALRLHHRAARKIFGGDQLDVFKLPFFFRHDGGVNFGIDLAQAAAGRRGGIGGRGSGSGVVRLICHGKGCRSAAARFCRHREFALFYEREHGR